MTVLSHRVTYQGKKCRAVKYRRTDGLTPETGYVDIAIEDLGNISLTMPQILWRNNGGMEVPGQLGIDDAFRKYSGEMKGRQTVAEQKQTKKGGLQLVGDLVMESFDGGSLGKEVYKDVYVAFEGIEEITERLASARQHREGFVRVPLSDIRQFYTDYGLLFQDINCRLRSGQYDPRTVKAGGVPWSVDEVVRFLFSQLPGSPKVHPDSKITGTNPPSEVIGEGEPIGGILQDLLNQYGLVAKFLPAGDFLVVPRWAQTADPSKYSRSPGSKAKWPFLKTERKSISGTNRPPLVCVKGRRRVQRVTLPYVPVIQWTDGRYYQLSDVGSLIPGYSIERVNQQVLNNESKNFQDVISVAGASGVPASSAYQYMQMLRKWAYKGYAPANAFVEAPNPTTTTGAPVASGARAGSAPKGTVHVIDDEDLGFLPFLPAVDAPWYKSDLKLSGMEMLYKGKSSQKSSNGDFDGVVLLPPIVKSRSIGEMWFDGAGEITRHLDRVGKSYGEEKKLFDSRVQIAQERAANFIDHINAANRDAKNIIKPGKIASEPKPQMLIDDETRQLAKGFGTFEDNLDSVLDSEKENPSIKATLAVLKNEVEAWKAAAKQADDVLKQHLRQVIGYQATYAAYRGFMGIGNLPAKLAERGKYTFDNQTGIVLFAEPQCVGRAALVMADEFNVVIGDGAVSVSFGYELRFNSVSDWTTVYVSPVPGAKGKPATAAVVGFCRPSGIKARLERMPDVTMYLDEFGQPMNMNFVTDAAVRKAQGQVSLPDGVEGYESVYHGFVPCSLDSGINSVQHEWSGGKTAAFTHVFQNFPGGIGPLGPAMVPTLSAAEGRARQRATIREIEER